MASLQYNSKAAQKLNLFIYQEVELVVLIPSLLLGLFVTLRKSLNLNIFIYKKGGGGQSFSAVLLREQVIEILKKFWQKQILE